MSTNKTEKTDKQAAFIAEQTGAPEQAKQPASAMAAQPMRFAEDGKPFPNKESADRFIKAKGLDPILNEAFKHQGGYCVFNLAGWPNEIIETFRAAEKALRTQTASQESAPKYSRVTFQSKANPNDEEAVTLSLNGTTLIFQRDIEVIIPDSYMEVADHAVHNTYEQKPGHKRKVTGKVRKFIYSRHGSASHEEFEAFKKKGNEIRDREFEMIARSGDRID